MDPIRTALVLVVAATFLTTPPAQAGTCTGAKLKTAGKALSSTLKCDAKAEAKGTGGRGASCDGPGR